MRQIVNAAGEEANWSALYADGFSSCSEQSVDGRAILRRIRRIGLHTYHDWAKRKEVKARFPLSGLMTGRKLRDETAKQ